MSEIDPWRYVYPEEGPLDIIMTEKEDLCERIFDCLCDESPEMTDAECEDARQTAESAAETLIEEAREKVSEEIAEWAEGDADHEGAELDDAAIDLDAIYDWLASGDLSDNPTIQELAEDWLRRRAGSVGRQPRPGPGHARRVGMGHT